MENRYYVVSQLNKPPVSIKPPPPSNGLEINKLPGGLNRGFTVALTDACNCPETTILFVTIINSKRQKWEKIGYVWNKLTFAVRKRDS